MMRSAIAIASVFCLNILSVQNAVIGDEALYVKQIRPLLKERCYACHGALKQEAGLRVDTGRQLVAGVDGQSIIDTTAPENSVLLERLMSNDDDIRMPPIGKPLSAEEVDSFLNWIAAGAHSPAGEEPEPDPTEHWSFQPLVRPDVPLQTDSAWVRNPIDNFILQQHAIHSLTPLSAAAPAHLLRRVTLDLTGIPPTRAELNDFLADPSEKHYEEIVDRLLASPLYGERWGRHWMDVWRYSDWYGRREQNDVRNSAPQIWRWRDWIVDSLNADKSYARMVQEMLAADEIAPHNDRTWPATGFLIRNYYSLNPNEWMRHNVEFTGKAFLGLTFDCAHCHDHKYDPISHDNYFQFRAFFEPLGIRQDRVLGEPEPPLFEPYVYSGSRKVVHLGMARVYDEKPNAPTWFYTGGDERNRSTDRGSIPANVPDFLNVPFGEITPVKLPMTGWYPGSRKHIQTAILSEQRAKVAAAETQLTEAQSQPVATTEVSAKLELAEAYFKTKLEQATECGERGALAGQQSVVLDAKNGRRILQRDFPELDALPDGAELSFTFNILKDGHFNFQLARNASKGLTALYVGFKAGEIIAYQPGTFSTFVVGQYPLDYARGDINVAMTLHPADDTATLTLEHVSGDGEVSTLVNEIIIALNGWNPVMNADQPCTFDCQDGGRILLDDVQFSAGKQYWSWGFEAPEFQEGNDVVGQSGWLRHSISSGDGSSVVSAVAGCTSSLPAYDELQQVKSEFFAATLPLRAAELGLAAAKLKFTSIFATIEADNAARDNAADDVEQKVASVAWASQLKADEADAQWRIVQAESELATAQLQVDTDEKKTAQVTKAQQQLTAAQTDLNAVRERQNLKADPTEYQRLSPVSLPHSTGRRKALAEWITHPKNPLTPRVAINHIWMRHFHSPFVDSMYDFGRNGKLPTHPDLLDWLAVEFAENNWSMKHIHRLIVTSQTYRMSSSSLEMATNLEIDPENRFLWKMNAGRMEAEVVRDSVLAIASKLDMTRGGQVLPNTKMSTTFRRSLYYEVYPGDGGHGPLSEAFDSPDPGGCFRRTKTIVPQQALALSNSELIHSAATKAAAEITIASRGDDTVFVQAAFESILGRAPTTSESVASTNFLAQQKVLFENDQKARESLVRVLFNHNDFLTIR